MSSICTNFHISAFQDNPDISFYLPISIIYNLSENYSSYQYTLYLGLIFFSDGAVTKLINVEKPVEIERRGVKRRMKDREPEVYESGLRSILPEKEEEKIVDRMDLDQLRKPDTDRGENFVLS